MGIHTPLALPGHDWTGSGGCYTGDPEIRLPLESVADTLSGEGPEIRIRFNYHQGRCAELYLPGAGLDDGRILARVHAHGSECAAYEAVILLYPSATADFERRLREALRHLSLIVHRAE